MGSGPTTQTTNGFGLLRQFVPRRRNAEACELCSAEISLYHPHLLELGNRRLLCTCDACALLFTGQAKTKYRRVPRDIRILDSFELSDADWDAFMIPINMAFFFTDSQSGGVHAYYPSPAGAIESLLSLESWVSIVKGNPVLQNMQSDVEALLVSRAMHGRSVCSEYFLLPIDECYRLVGIIRNNWRGFSGGSEVWREIAEFFAGLRNRAVRISREHHA
ncbi:MAG TPA: DUF5947 family protein [Candidatus Sulfotelmatobacter sp.]|nr:DUF5947 family protein [Candidatus Sulfotelmatobacter sp.]